MRTSQIAAPDRSAAPVLARTRTDRGWAMTKRVPLAGPGTAAARQRLLTHYQVTAGLDLSWVPVAVSLRLDEGDLVLSMPQAPGVSFAERIRSGEALAPGEVALIGAQIAQRLAELIDRRVVHGGIDVTHVMYDEESGELTLLNFGRGGFLHGQHATIEGTWLRPRDHDEDLRGLGALLAMLASGGRAEVPPPELPRGLRTAIERLVRAGERDAYRHAAAAAEGLTALSDDVGELGEQLGSPPDIRLPTRRYGRHAQVAELLAAGARVAGAAPHGLFAGTSAVVLLSGPSGIGKTAVIEDCCRVLRDGGGLVGRGKCDQYVVGRPYAALAQAFEAAVAQVLDRDSRARAEVRERLLHSLGDLAQVIVDLVPPLAELIGPQPEVPKLPPVSASMRQELLLERFVAGLASPREPLVLFLDDLHWADPALLRLLATLLRPGVLRNVLLIGSYRDEETSLAQWRCTLTDAGSDLNLLAVGPLSAEEVGEMMSDVGLPPGEETAALAAAVHETGRGNPLLSLILLVVCHDTGLLFFDAGDGGWRAVPDPHLGELTIEETVTRALERQPAETRHLLSRAAYLGVEFDLGTLAAVTGTPPEGIAAALWPALVTGLLAQVEGLAPSQRPDVLSAGAVNLRYRFAHDTIQQAAHALVPAEEAAACHRSIGEALHERYRSGGRLGEDLFEAVNHLNLGIGLAAPAEERRRVAALNLEAALLARGAGATGTAREHLLTGIALLPGEPSVDGRRLLFDLWLGCAGTAYLLGDFDAMDEAVVELEGLAASELDRARVAQSRVESLVARNRMADAFAVGEQALATLGVALGPMPSSPEEWPRVPELGELDRSAPAPPQADAALRLLLAITPAAFDRSFETYARVITTMVGLATEQPSATVTPSAFVGYGVVLCGLGRSADGYRAGELALSLAGEDPAIRCDAQTVAYGMLWAWERPLRESLPRILETLELARESGQPGYVGYASFLYCDKAWLLARSLSELEQLHALHTALVRQHGQDYSLTVCRAWLQFMRALQGRAEHSDVLKGEAFDEDVELPKMREAQSVSTLFTTSVLKSILALHAGDLERAAELAREAEPCAASGAGTMLSVEHSLVWCLALYGLGGEERVAEAEVPLERLRAWADTVPRNVGAKLELAEAERDRVRGEAGAWRRYEDAIDTAAREGLVHDQALACELAGAYYGGEGLGELARWRLGEAYSAYLRCGAGAAAEGLLARHPLERAVDAGEEGRLALDVDGAVARLLEDTGADRVVIALDSEPALVGDLIAGDGVRVLRHGDAQGVALPAAMLAAAREGRLIRERAPADSEEWGADDYLAARRPASVIAYPLRRGAAICGAAYVESRRPRLLDRAGEGVEAIAAAMRADDLATALSQRSLVDPVTSLPNRWSLLKSADMLLARERAQGRLSPAIVTVGFARFHDVVESMAEAHGDDVLREVADSLLDVAGASDVASRVGDSSFAILVRGRSDEELAGFAERVAGVLGQPYRGALSIAAAVGVCAGTGYARASNLLRDAEIALEESLGQEPGHVTTFDAALHRGASTSWSLERDLRAALADDALRLVYQPIVDSGRDGTVVAYEALLRWHDPRRGEVPPLQMIAIAEEAGFVADIDRWVARRAVGQLRAWRAAGMSEDIAVHLNVSPVELLAPGFDSQLIGLLHEAQLPDGSIVVELTESTLLDAVGRAQRNLQALRDAGIRLCIDDFGTGYSSLSRLHECPIDMLKIDKAFIRGLEAGDSRRPLVDMIVSLARTLDLEVVAEGVETATELDLVREAGCRLVQGYLFSRPVEAGAVAELRISAR
jgi:diguanylate cyclase (GGDEF)-like protein